MVHPKEKQAQENALLMVRSQLEVVDEELEQHREKLEKLHRDLYGVFAGLKAGQQMIAQRQGVNLQKLSEAVSEATQPYWEVE